VRRETKFNLRMMGSTEQDSAEHVVTLEAEIEADFVIRGTALGKETA
jgi:hypothetical protein